MIRGLQEVKELSVSDDKITQNLLGLIMILIMWRAKSIA
jgi:hypothetical protein